jgi:endonuclease/exonuclease/phosphatase family metal-dependent hydrolase
MMVVRKVFIVLVCGGLAAVMIGCAAPGSDANSPQTHSVTIMTFNVENLFDTEDDLGKDDLTYLPFAAKQSAAHIAQCNKIEVEKWRTECLELDWNDDVLAHKLATLAAAIRQLDGGPDIIAFQEVEKASLLNRLSREYLADFGYLPAILIEGQDLRGIDTGFLSRLPLVGAPVLHPLVFAEFPDREADTRGILEATFELPDGSRLTGFAVHFPAPFHPTAMREAAYEQLNSLRRAVAPENAVFAAGDFNTVSTEVAATGILEHHVRPDWVIAHESGCAGCRGSYYYARDDNWSWLDMILWSPARGENATWQIRADSFRVVNVFEQQVSVDGSPARFSPDTGTGVSDHWPLALTLELSQKQ